MAENQSITNQFINLIEKNVVSKPVKSLLSANDLYNKMVSDGIVKKRGYNLKGLEDAHLFRNNFINTPSYKVKDTK